MFKNTRTGASAMELRAYKTEDEATAMARLKAAGWSFNIEYYFDEKALTFTAGKKEMETDEDGDSDD